MVDRNMTPQMLAAIDAPVVMPITLVDVGWPTGEVHTSDARRKYEFNGNEYLGIGPFGQVAFPSASISALSQTARLSLAFPGQEGMDELSVSSRNRPVSIHWGLLHPDTLELVRDPVTEFVGRITSSEFKFTKDRDGNLFTIFNLGCTSGVPARSAAVIEHSFEQQQSVNPLDTGGRHLWDIVVKKQIWD